MPEANASIDAVFEAAEEWMATHEGTFALSVDDGFRLGRMNNDARFGAVLDRS